MAEILIKAVDAILPDTDADRQGCYKKGMCVVVVEDGHPWATSEGSPDFALIKVPEVSTSKISKYIQPEYVGEDVYRRREWQIQWDELPQVAKDKLLESGGLTIKAGAYAGSYDYTWAQVKGFFKNHATGLRETEDI